jgi:SAM-dependent methyltransferase
MYWVAGVPAARAGLRQTELVPADDLWAPLAGRFVDGHYGTLRGRVRTYVIAAHLREHLPGPPAALVDVGGGAGNQSIPLARAGYQVTIVDPSEAMLARAQARLAAEPGEVAGRVRLVRAGADGARELLGGARFAGVLCHGVIMYVEDPRPFVAALADLAEPGGIVSLVAKNAMALVTRPALEGNWAQALAAFDADRQVNGLGLDTRADTVDDLAAMLAESGVEQIAWYGVRLFTDSWTPAQLGEDAEDQALEVELQASRRDPYRLMSRLFHLVGRRSLAS